ncbi:MAG: hypothetical protein EXR62_02285 [Chloroflexi bacterium]|nr:hypothetical protein [Chloroflexota bacterium]
MPPRLPLKGLWLVGDSIFPGQSTAGVTLGTMHVAGAIAGQTITSIKDPFPKTDGAPEILVTHR